MKYGKIMAFAASALAASVACAAEAASVTVDCAKEIGKIKPLNGVNFGPKTAIKDIKGYDERGDFYALNVHSVRLHDVSAQNAGMMIVDTNMVFPLFHADPNDPRNYLFGETDDYLKAATAKGAKIVYRLGITIDHSIAKRRTTPPPDPEKWAEICCHIIAHYNDGWANGHKMNIEYWEIWNEPELINWKGKSPMWNGTMKQFTDFYIRTAKIIKARYPHLKIGGAAFTFYNPTLRKFVEDIAAAKAPLDFISWHYYDNDITKLTRWIRENKLHMLKNGFPNAEIHINEWHCMPFTWAELRKDRTNYLKFKNLFCGVWAGAAMTAMQDTPIDVANFYTYSSGNFGMLDAITNKPAKCYYPFKAFGDLLAFPTRLAASSSADNVYSLAGKSAGGKVAALVNIPWAKRGGTLDIEFKNCKSDLSKAKVLLCDDDKNLEPADGVKIGQDKISLDIKSDSICVFVEL